VIFGFVFVDNDKYSGKDEDETTSCGGDLVPFSSNSDVFDSCEGSSNTNTCNLGFRLANGRDMNEGGW